MKTLFCRIFLLMLLLALLSGCGAKESAPLPEPSPFDAPVDQARILSDFPSELRTFTVTDPFTRLAEVQTLVPLDYEEQSRQSDEAALTDTILCTVTAENDHYRATCHLRLRYHYEDGWKLDSWESLADVSYQVLSNPFLASAATAKPGFTLSNTGFDKGDCTFTYRKVTEKPLCDLAEQQTVHTTFDGAAWTLTEGESSVAAEDWALTGTWAIDYSTWDGYHLQSELTITDFDWASQCISGSWHVKVTWFTEKIDETREFTDEPLLVQGNSSFRLPELFRYSAFFKDEQMELEVNEQEVRILTSLHPLFEEGVYALTPQNP